VNPFFYHRFLEPHGCSYQRSIRCLGTLVKNRIPTYRERKTPAPGAKRGTSNNADSANRPNQPEAGSF
jgi:hypothetical protein